MKLIICLLLCLPIIASAATVNIKSCKMNADCMLIQNSCCDCNNGGKQQAINRKYAATVKQQNQTQCANMMCATYISLDKSCKKGAKAVCQTGLCQIKT